MKCCICKNKIYECEESSASIFMMSGFGVPKYVCKDCEDVIETVSNGKEPDKIEEACRKLGEALTAGNTEDMNVINEVNSIITDAAERAAAIREGTYDFALEEEMKKEAEAEEQFEITEDLMETEEDRRKDERDAKVNRVMDTVFAWISGVVIGGALIYFIYNLIF